jgi:endonuclease YncB( thermonuclease family)
MFFALSDICLSDECDHTADTFNCVKYLRNFDGDTFAVDIPNVHPFFGSAASIRILGIDTAEITGKNECERKKALKARQRTQELLSNSKKITLTNLKRDKYNRTLARVTIDNTIDLGQTLLNENLAYKYNGEAKPKIDWCNITVIFKK